MLSVGKGVFALSLARRKRQVMDAARRFGSRADKGWPVIGAPYTLTHRSYTRGDE